MLTIIYQTLNRCQQAAAAAHIIAGRTAVNFYTEAFARQGFTDRTLRPWPDVQRRTNPRRPDTAAARRPILTGQTAQLGRSIRYQPLGTHAVRIYSDLPYAAAHNFGTTTAGRRHHTTIAARPFIAPSATLNQLIINQITKLLTT